MFIPEENTMIAADGARLGLSVWPAEGTSRPAHVIVGVHGMNNYAGEFRLAAPEWAAQGMTVYAYDQRGFGRSDGRGRWPDEALLRADLCTAVDLARARHPGAEISVIGLSMGAAVAITAFASDDPPKADRLIASGPGFRGWKALNPVYAASLRASAAVRPGWVVRPPAAFKPRQTDNDDFIGVQDADPLHLQENRIDQVEGVVTLMAHAEAALPRLPPDLPVLLSYGAHDQVIPENGVRRAARLLPAHARTVYYADGYHMLLSDLQRGKTIADYARFIEDADAPLPSGAPEWPFR